MVNPAQVAVQAQDSIQLVARALDEFGNEIGGVVVTWSAEGGIGSIDQQGLFAAGTRAGFYAGSIRVAATQGDQVRETAVDVSVTPGPFSNLLLIPPEVTLDIGATRSFTLRVFDKFGNEIFDALTSWSIETGAGTVSADGVFIAGTKAGVFPGAVRVQAVKGTDRATVTADLSIRPGPLASINVGPLSPIVRRGDTVQLTATGLDRYGNEIPDLEFLWEGAEGLSVDQTGMVTTGGPLTPPAGLVGWWTGDGSARDAASGNNGVLEGGPSFSPGIVGQAFSFDRLDDRVIVPDASNLNIQVDPIIRTAVRLK